METAAVQERYSETTRDITVTVSPAYLEERSDPEQGLYSYSYTVWLENAGADTVQLINRHWVVISGGRQIADVKGEGVVGQQPVLQPGDLYEYTSWTAVKDPVGAMYGAFTFYSESGEFFDVPVPKFNLIYIDENAAVH